MPDGQQQAIAPAKEKELKVVRQFIEVYCREHCGRQDGSPCPDCQDLLAYATDRLRRCPFDPKPKCKDCKVHCYRGAYRDMIRQVMRFSGMHMVKRGRVDLLLRYFLPGRGR